MKKILIMSLLLLIVTGCSSKPKDTPLEQTPTNTTGSEQNKNATEEQVYLYANENKPASESHTSEIELYVISDNVIGYRVIQNSSDGSLLSSQSSKNTDGTKINPDDANILPQYGSDDNLGFITREAIEQNQLKDTDYVYYKISAVLENGDEVECVNELIVENRLGYLYGPVYMIEENGNFVLRLEK
ncbi:hypothetical protein [Anaerorhabdus sp.]|uniref:hypothetical protein n=1 Tax=Anaerorhabdus sp. TaxID=1872524 RepID=UPI002FCC6738